MTTAVSIENVSRNFGVTTALLPIDLEIREGEFVSFIGPSGCGKTTLLRIVADLETATTGCVTIGGASASEARRQKRLGLVSQRPAVLPWKRAIDDVRFTQAVTGKSGLDANELLSEFGLLAHKNKFPRELSGGMLQRVNFASAIAHDPSVLLMDEPFSALDEMRREEMGYWLSIELTRIPKTALFVTHHIDEAVFLSDRVIVFSPPPGRILRDIRLSAPRPRGPEFRSSDEYVEKVEEVRALLFGGRAARSQHGH